MTRLEEWIAEERPGAIWFLKRLSANDTQATGSHQAGPYVAKQVIFRLFPELEDRRNEENPRVEFPYDISSSPQASGNATAIWYNNRLKGGTRNETRVTGFGGSDSVLLTPENTGALAVFVFFRSEGGARRCGIWVCTDLGEEDVVEGRFGPVEPSEWVLWPPVPEREAEQADCWLSPGQMPEAWLQQFPPGVEIARKAIEMRPDRSRSPDERLIRRSKCEYRIFRSLESAVVSPRVREGFAGVDQFVDYALSVLNRRKTRAGKSLELHLETIFGEEDLRAGRDFEYNVESEPGRHPDFLFPSQAAYRDPGFPTGRLRMLGVKRTARDRWRQILNEADRIQTKHLLTLQEGVSPRQFAEMRSSSVVLVVPAGLHRHYREPVRSQLLTLTDFLADARACALPNPPTS